VKKRRVMNNRIYINKIVLLIPLFSFIVIILQMANLSLSTKVDDIDLKQFSKNRNTNNEILYANRGTIYSSDGNILAQNVDSYTVIAYLSPKRSEGLDKPRHVVDKQMTAKALSPLINMSEEAILKLLNKENLYQVELRPGGMGITELKKEEIEKLMLPGIDFIQTFKRYYPNNDFLAYTLGYVRMSDDLKITGEMGIEKYFNDYLSGKDGYLKYQKDLKGYKIPNTKEIREEAVEGLDIYLTIDENIQLFTERVVKESYEEYKPEWMIMTVADAKTGRILGTTSSPSFDPNIKNIESYLNPLVSYTYEPGSTMKTFTYMAAMEKGTYKGDELFKSGKYQIGEDVISDWNNKGWGDITYDQGYTLSSNVAITNIVNKFINRSDLKKYFEKLGFGRKTGFTLPNEAEGKINFKYEVEVANAGFGQGITTTPIQFIQALTSIANDGVMLKPYIIDKIVDPNTGEIAFEGKKEEIGRVASKDTISKIKDLMYQVINGDPTYATGLSYKVDGCEMIGKTGTAQFVNPKTGKYETGSTNYLRSFSGMFPKEDPQIIIYVVSKRPLYGAGNSVSKPTVKLANDIIKYLNVNGSTTNSISEDNFVIPNLINNKVDILNDIKHEKVVIGDGDKIINQYPKANITLNSHDKLFVMTNGKNILLPNMTNWSNRDVSRYCNLVNLKCNIEGYGFVSNQDVKEGTNIKEVEQLNILLKRSNKKVEVGS